MHEEFHDVRHVAHSLTRYGLMNQYPVKQGVGFEESDDDEY